MSFPNVPAGGLKSPVVKSNELLEALLAESRKTNQLLGEIATHLKDRHAEKEASAAHIEALMGDNHDHR
ncbi:MAG: hypothetical protein Q8S53_09595 [Brevundimonas sp.]|uniref:hypothetical protein n=1 Tax=Brevundimonas sp. TaxID=1871086 RepID=UPI002734AB6F|nr:hypothetical protein [Brevundimonas sp.]MDP3378608.1 hypothetical protein [Brevundimonas sp.]